MVSELSASKAHVRELEGALHAMAEQVKSAEQHATQDHAKLNLLNVVNNLRQRRTSDALAREAQQYVGSMLYALLCSVLIRYAVWCGVVWCGVQCG